MTDCNTPVLTFSSLGRRKVVADFSGGSLTSDAGLLLLREADKRLGLLDRLDAAVADPRDPSRTTHDQRTLLAQRVFALAAGYEDLNDHDALRLDPLMQTVVDRAPDKQQPLGSDSTLCRLENRITRADLIRISQVLVEVFIASRKTPPDELVLDFDPTFDPVHGEQVGRFFHGYYDDYGFLPLYVFCGHDLLVAHLRTADGDNAKHVLPILAMLVKRLQQAWPAVKIVLRADSGLCRPLTLNWCERHGVSYVIGLAGNPVLLRLAESAMRAAAERFAVLGQPCRVFGEVSYAAGTWSRQRRVIVKAEHIPDKNASAGKANPRFVVTNLSVPAQALYEEVYCARGDMENRIKEQQLMLFSDRTSCHEFNANAFRLLLSSAAYVLFEYVRREGLQGTELATAQVSTIRNRLLKLGAAVIVSVRRVYLRLAGGFPLQDLFAKVLARLQPSPTATAPEPSG